MAPVPSRPVPIRWRQSLIFRTIALCTVLLLCLLGLVYVLTSHFYTQTIVEMRRQAEAIAEDVVVHLNANPDESLDALAGRYHDDYTDVELSEIPAAEEEVEVPARVSVHMGDDGRVTKTAQTMIQLADRRILVQTSVTLSPQTEIVRAFMNRNLIALTALFLITLGLMIYFIRKTLRPLGELSESCAQISAGNLKEVAMRNSSGEVLALERAFNRMVASLKDQEQMESRLRQAQRLSSIGNLAAGVAHDIRNPLNAIKLLAGHTLDTLAASGSSADAEQRAVRQLNTIRTEVHRLEEIVSGFLSLARESELQPEEVRIDQLIDECIRLVRKDAEDRRVRLIAELRAGDASLTLDPKRWSRAILNVLINAMEACPAEGRVRVFSRLRDADCQIEIRDDGPGMSRETLEHAFDPYYTTKPTGTGLGLSITRGIVEEHGGTIELSSGEGPGCQVLITLPLTSRENP